MENKKKIELFRILKVISYLAGFPLLVLMVLIDSMPFQKTDVFGDTAWNAVIIVAAIWAFVTCIQIVLKLLGTKQKVRTVVALLLTFALLIGPAVLIESVWTKKVEAIAEEAPEGVNVKTFQKQAGYYNATTKGKGSYVEDVNANVQKVLNIYNIGYEAIQKSRDLANRPLLDLNGNILRVDADNGGSKKATSGTLLLYKDDGTSAQVGTWKSEAGVDFDGNDVTLYDLTFNEDVCAAGTEFLDMVPASNGWWYFNKTVLHIETLEDYERAFNGGYREDYKLPNYYAGAFIGEGYYSPNGMLADGNVFSLESALMILEDYNLAVNKYGSTLDAEYAAAVAAAQASDEWQAYIATDEYAANTADSIKYYLTAEELDVVLGIVGGKLEGSNLLTLASLLLDETVIAQINDDMTLETLEAMVAGFGLDKQALINLAGSMLSSTDPDYYDSMGAVVMDLLGNFSYYNSPYNQQIYDFFAEEDADLAAYGRALYYGKKQGSVIGSTLIGDKLGAGKYPADGFALSLSAVQQMQTDLSYQPDMYPLVSAMRYMYIFCGIVALSIIVTANCADKQRKLEENEEEE